MLFLVLLYSILTQPHVANCEDDYFVVGDLSQYTTSGVCIRYMVEGTTLYKYSGTLPEGSTAAPWSW